MHSFTHPKLGFVLKCTSDFMSSSPDFFYVLNDATWLFPVWMFLCRPEIRIRIENLL